MQLLSIKVSTKPFQKMIFGLGSGSQKSFFEKRGGGFHFSQPQEPVCGPKIFARWLLKCSNITVIIKIRKTRGVKIHAPRFWGK